MQSLHRNGNNEMNIFSFLQIKALFNDDIWDIGYLYPDEMKEVLNTPIKFPSNLPIYTEELNFKIYLIIIKKTKNFDYTIRHDFYKTVKKNIPNLNLSYIYCNYKYAAVLAGLGQYARNTLLYHNKFQFETHFTMFGIEQELTELPIRNEPNFSLLKRCENCYDCIKACPAQALHINSQGKTWIDTVTCDNFNHYNNHPTIPSLKENWSKIEAPWLTEQQLFQIKSGKSCLEIANKSINHEIWLKGKKYSVIYPICRECSSQKRCSQFNGNYPYDKNEVSFFQI